MHGERQRMWLSKLKSALIMKEVEKISLLLEEKPKDLTAKELEEASFLLREAAKIATSLRDETVKTMKQLKKNIDFLNATESKKVQKFDITS